MKRSNEGANKNVAQGHINEILLAKALNPNGSLPDHFREPGMDPQSVLERSTEILGAETAATIEVHAYEMVDLLTAQLISDGLMCNTSDVRSVTWTSLGDNPGTPGDHEMLTGIKDIRSDADVMLQVDSSGQFVGVSAKYGSSKDITLNNPGKAWIENRLGLGDLDEFKIPHDRRMIELGYSGNHTKDHESWKDDKSKNLPRAVAAVESSLKYRTQIANAIRHRLDELGSDEIKSVVLDLCANRTIHIHYRTHTRPTKNGVKHHVSNTVKYSEERVELYDNYHVNLSQAGTRVTIYARRKKCGTIEPVANLSIKGKSGPMQNWNGNFNAPLLTDKRRKKKVLYSFDMDDTLFWYDDEESARVAIICDEGNVVERLTPGEYTDHSLQTGYLFGYDEFTSSKIFSNTARPIQKMLDRLRRLVDKGCDVNIVTARGDFDDKDLFLSTLRRFGIDTDKVHVHWCGTSRGVHPSNAVSKQSKFLELIEAGGYDEIHFWDDNSENLLQFLNIENLVPAINLVAYRVQFNVDRGTCLVKKVRREDVLEG